MTYTTINVYENTTGVLYQVNLNGGPGSYSFDTSSFAHYDYAAFNLESDGRITFKTPPDFEAPLDYNSDNIYDVRVMSWTYWAPPTSKYLYFRVLDVNEAPTNITFANIQSIDENTNSNERIRIADISVADPDTKTASYRVHSFTITKPDGSVDNHFEADNSGLYLKAGASLDYEAQPSITLKVNAADAGGSVEKSVTFSVNNKSDAPTNVTLSTDSVAENSSGGVVVGMLSATTPGGGQATFTINASNTSPFVIDGNTVKVKSGAVLDFEAGPKSYDLIVNASSGGDTTQKTLKISLTDANEAPTLMTVSAPSPVAENTIDQTVLATVSLVDPDNNPHFPDYAYTVNDDRFFIKNAKLYLKDGQTTNFEAEPTIPLTVTASDGVFSINAQVTVSVTNVAEAPTDLALSETAIAENSAAGTVVGQLSANAPAGGAVSYVLSAAGATAFELDGLNVKLKDGVALDFESQTKSYDLVVSALSGGETTQKAFTINIGDVAEAPTDLALSGTSIAENSAAGAVVGQLSANAPAGGAISYALGGDGASAFELDGLNVKLKYGVALDFESSTKSYYLIVSASSGGETTQKTFTINIGDVAEAPTDLALSGTSIAENSAAGTVIGQLSAVAPAGGTISYALSGDGVAAFELDGVNVKSKTGVAFDFESSTKSYYLIVSASSGGETTRETFTINIGDVAETPTDLTLSATSIAENSAAGTVVGQLSAKTPAGGVISYSISGDGVDLFELDGAAIKLKPGAVLDFESGAKSYNIDVAASSGGETSAATTFTINVSDVAEAPTDLALSKTSIAENSAAGTTVGDLSAIAPAGGAVTYALTGAGADLFELDGATVKLKTGASFDFESGITSYDLEVKASSGGETSEMKKFTINVSDVAEAPTDLALSETSIAENSAAGTIVGQLSAGAPAGGAVSYALSGAGATAFELDGLNVKLRDGVALDFESQTKTYDLIINASSGGETTQKTITINVSDVAEAPTDLALSETLVAENSAAGTIVGELSAISPVGGAVAYALTGAGADLFELDGAKVKLKAGASFDFESGTTSYDLEVKASSGGETSEATKFTVDLSNVNEAPGAVAVQRSGEGEGPMRIAENTSAKTELATVFVVGDPDNSEAFAPYLYKVNDSRFTIEDGKLYLKAGQATDFETEPQIKLTITADDGSFKATLQDVLIEVTDVGESSPGGGGGPITPTTPTPTTNENFDGVIPALVVSSFVEGEIPDTGIRLDSLAEFAKVQFLSYQERGVLTPGLGPYEALGVGFSETIDFHDKYGALTEATFVEQAYKDVFSRQATSAQADHFQAQIDYFEALYMSVKIPEARAEMMAKGAALGQMLGFAVLDESKSQPYLAQAEAFIADAADGTVEYGKPLAYYELH